MSLRNFNKASKSIVLPSPAESWLEHTVIDFDSEHHLNVRFRDMAVTTLVPAMGAKADIVSNCFRLLIFEQ